MLTTQGVCRVVVGGEGRSARTQKHSLQLQSPGVDTEERFCGAGFLNPSPLWEVKSALQTGSLSSCVCA